MSGLESRHAAVSRRIAAGALASFVLAGCSSTQAPSTNASVSSTPSAVEAGGASPSDPMSTDPVELGADAGDELLSSLIGDRWGELGPTRATPPNPGDGTAGAGCTPGDPEGLPDGVWLVEVVGYGDATLEVDLLCYSTVQSAEAAEPGSGNDMIDFEITNDSPATRTLEVGENPNFLMLSVPPIIMVGTPFERSFWALTPEAMAYAAEVGDPTPLGWIWVESGVVLEFFQPALVSA